jgi:hypothetical protein
MAILNNKKAACLALIFSMSISMTACTQAAKNKKAMQSITLEDIIKANKTSVLLNKYDNIQEIVGGEYIIGKMFYSKDLISESYEDYTSITNNTDNWMVFDEEGGNYLVYRWYAMSNEDKKDYLVTIADYESIIIDPESATFETITGVEDNKDGTYTVTTKISAENNGEILKQFPYELPEECYSSESKIIYIIDKDTLEISSCKEYIMLKDRDLLLLSCEYSYNNKQPDILSTATAMFDDFKNGNINDPQTYKVFYDYGSDAEESYEITIDSRFKIYLVLKDGYDYVYLDPEKTTPYDGNIIIDENILYAFKEP